MSHIALWLVDWLFATLLILGAGAVAVALCRHVALRERIAELSLAAAVLAAIPAAVPSTHRLSLGLLPAPERPHAKVHIGAWVRCLLAGMASIDLWGGCRIHAGQIVCRLVVAAAD
jgi:hypothetical protein